MTTTNSHDKALVSAINDIMRTPSFIPSFQAKMLELARKYADEVYEKVLNSDEDEEGLLDRMSPSEFCDIAGESFLTHVCDDADLKELIEFCGWTADHTNPNRFYRITFNDNGVYGSFVYGHNKNHRQTPALLDLLANKGARLYQLEITWGEYMAESYKCRAF